jgi:hypothetical protein
MEVIYRSKIVGIKAAAEITGLSQWELRQGAKLGKYPCLRVGSKNGKILFNVELLISRINKIMELNLKN